jgi:hypothetical protein
MKHDVPAGTYRVQCDHIIITAVDVQFELIHRRAGSDTVLATWNEHFEPLPGDVYEAQAYEIDQPVSTAIDFEPGDQFVWRFIGTNATSPAAFIPNGDGVTTGGRIPRIVLPN